MRLVLAGKKRQSVLQRVGKRENGEDERSNGEEKAGKRLKLYVTFRPSIQVCYVIYIFIDKYD